MNRLVLLCVFTLLFCSSAYSSVVFNELLVNPVAQGCVFKSEFIELYNNGNDSVNLQDWQIVGGVCPCVLPKFYLQANSFIIISGTSAIGQFDVYGKSLYCKCFPALTNTGKLLTLVNDSGRLQDYINYSDTWYNSTAKEAGGWSLERKDPNNKCSCAANWTACQDSLGATPGRANSVLQTTNTIDTVLMNIASVTDTTVTISFSQQMDSVSLLNAGNYSTDHNFQHPFYVQSNFPFYNQATVFLPAFLHQGEVYRITLSPSILDCGTQPIHETTLRFALPDTLLPNDLIINEILFNPKTGGSDFVELYNRSNKTLDLKTVMIANKNLTTLAIYEQYPVCAKGMQVFPCDYVVITDNIANIRENYPVPQTALIAQITSMPSYPDAAGIVSLLNTKGTVIDEFSYSASYQSEQLTNVEGVSLERINPNGASEDATNWHSASWSCGFATPGYQNSQYNVGEYATQTISISPKIISPNNDGVDDVASFNYEFPSEGFIATIYIFNQLGTLSKKLVTNKTLATTGTLYWDGTDDNLNTVPIGIYIVQCNAFTLQGKKIAFRTTCIVAAK